jgi:hypothetical protein
MGAHKTLRTLQGKAMEAAANPSTKAPPTRGPSLAPLPFRGGAGGEVYSAAGSTLRLRWKTLVGS